VCEQQEAANKILHSIYTNYAHVLHFVYVSLASALNLGFVLAAAPAHISFFAAITALCGFIKPALARIVNKA
jgi:hypothetical protein